MSYYSDEEWSDSDGRSGSRTQATSMTRAEPRARIRARREEPFSGNTVSSTESAIDNHDKYRMGAPGTLLPLPLENSPIVIEDALTRAWVHIRLEVIKLLQKREIEFQNMSIVHRHLPNTTPDKVKTLLVTATASNSSDSWILFLDDCHTLLAVGLEVQDFKIEIIDPRAVLGKLIYPIGLGDDIIEIWPLLRPRIHRELDGKDWRAIQVMKMGYMIPEVTPAVTIILTVSNMFDLRWVENLKKIDEILQESPYVDLDLKLHLIQGSVNWQIGRPTSIVPQQFQQEVSIGSSIGPDSGSGTLGLYIKTSSSSGAMKILGLTNCHVIRTEFLTQNHDEKGFVNTDLKNPVNIFSPSLMDKERSVETQQAHAEDLNIPIERLIERAASGLNDRATKLASLQERREKCLSNIKMISEFDCSFGVVEVASGLRHGPMNCSIDWALVDPKQERIPGIPNSLPDYLSFPRQSGWKPNDAVERVDISALIPSKRSQCVFKSGRTTGLTWGQVNVIRTDVLLENQIYSAVDIVPPQGHLHDFSQSGDSGSTVFDAKGDLCGLLFAGTDPVFAHGAGKAHGLVIPIDVVFDDIEAFTGLKVELP